MDCFLIGEESGKCLQESFPLDIENDSKAKGGKTNQLCVSSNLRRFPLE